MSPSLLWVASQWRPVVRNGRVVAWRPPFWWFPDPLGPNIHVTLKEGPS